MIVKILMKRVKMYTKGLLKLGCLSVLAGAGLAAAEAVDTTRQESLEPVVNAPGPVLEFDWPLVTVGTASYEQGPTGVTVIRFGRKVYSAIDVRGGAPGTVNAAYMNIQYDIPELDAVVMAGGSWYGLEAVTAVATALKDEGIRDGNAFGLSPSIAMSVGSIIFDFGRRRLNEIYPDKRLAQAALRAARPGVFPLGATGAGRFAMTGGFFGCGAHSGQGGAFRQLGRLKIAAFVVVNAYGVVTDRDGRVVACYPASGWPQDLRTADLLDRLPQLRGTDLSGDTPPEDDRSANTTVSLVVTNQTLTPVELKRLAVQVHTSMGRAIQPFATIYDGDVLYAVSTAELDSPVMSVPDLGAVASEVMWDAVLSSVPEQPIAATPASQSLHDREELARMAGDYRFSRFVTIRISVDEGWLVATAVGERDAYAIKRDELVELRPVSGTDFMIPGRYPLTLRFPEDGRLVINPGTWQQVGTRIVEE